MQSEGNSSAGSAPEHCFAGELQEGQQIEEFERVCEVQSDKASVEITSRFAGTVRQLRHAVGDIVQACYRALSDFGHALHA